MRRPFKKSIAVLLVVGAPCAVIGLGLCLAAAFFSSDALFIIGASYFGLGGLCLLIRAGLGLWGDAMRRSRGARRSSESSSGMALVSVLVIMALLSVLVMHSLRASAVSLRSSRARALQSTAQRHASEAAWYAVKAMLRSSAAPEDYVTPGGAEVSVSIRDVGAPPGLDLAGSKHRYRAVQASAVTNGVAREVYCVTRTDSAGELAIVRWVERP